MTAVAVEITTRPRVDKPTPVTGVAPEPTGLVFVDDVESLTAGAVPGCGDDNPYN
ncbi:hypothetical protein ACWERV_16175 [Streptomyces sp. NPDC004031]